MRRIRASQAIIWSLLALLTLAASPPAASASTGPAATTTAATAAIGVTGTSQEAALTRAFAAARELPGSAIGGVRAGSLHTGRADGTQWAIATFTPSASAGQQVAAGFQDGAATGVFRRTAAGWRLAGSGPYGCGPGLPAALKSAWRLADPASCTATPASERPGAQAARSRMVAQAAQSRADGSPAQLGESIAAAALSQVGVSDTPDVTSFAGTDCDPYSTLVAGFSANSDGCGYDAGFGVENENEAWCSDFNKWVWQQAGVTADMNTLNAGSVSFYDWALSQGQAPAPDSGTPQVGDSVVFFGPGPITASTYADHVGVVTAVNADGTITMVNGDFLGAANVSVEYDPDISLTSWAASVWGPGEQWVIVAPPTAAQQPVPSARLRGPRSAVTATTGAFSATATEPGGDISQYYWTFGDGRTTNATGAHVTHVFSEAGRYTVTVTVTSGFGTIVTKTWNVDVRGASSAVAAVPSDAVWFSTTPVEEYLFTRSGGGLAAQAFDGASWLELPVPGQPAAGGEITALSYPDPAAGDAMTPHAYFRSADGSLAQTYLNGTTWVSASLPGRPEAGSAITAVTTASGGPGVFFYDARGRLTESTRQQVLTLPGPATTSQGTLALAATAAGPVLVSPGPAGQLVVRQPAGDGWRVSVIGAVARPGSPLAALTTPAGRVMVFFTRASGGLAAATLGRGGTWTLTGLPGTTAATLAAANYLLPSPSAVPLGEEVVYLSQSRQPAADYDSGAGWQAVMLPSATGGPGATAGLAGLSAYPAAGQPTQVFLDGAAGALTEDSAGDPSGTWTQAALPTTLATLANRVVLYAATAADEDAATTAATAAGLPAGQVTRSYATAWDDALSGNYLVISVGLAATDALYYNACGWDNPSGDIPGSTPFYIADSPLAELPGAGAFEEGAASTAALSQQRATDLAYYAANGTLPAGVTSVPAQAGPQDACSGSPS
ncbi:MAG TPA: PKD domain-containing protein [Trebonia sp.]|nr:PKD domain-containing protein [Trebonia sp.]